MSFFSVSLWKLTSVLMTYVLDRIDLWLMYVINGAQSLAARISDVTRNMCSVVEQSPCVRFWHPTLPPIGLQLGVCQSFIVNKLLNPIFCLDVIVIWSNLVNLYDILAPEFKWSRRDLLIDSIKFHTPLYVIWLTIPTTTTTVLRAAHFKSYNLGVYLAYTNIKTFF